MKVVLEPLPVLFACKGCLEHGDHAAELALRLERCGRAQAVLLGAPHADEAQLASLARSRYPVQAVDGCARSCAWAWLKRQGAAIEHRIVLA
jgi:uncharacterized metal-binding protein